MNQTAARTASLHAVLLQIPGVVDHGWFVGIASRIIVGQACGTTRTIG